MDGSIQRETSNLGSLFQHIIQDMKNGMPLWEDLIVKATKLHSSLRSAIQAIAAYLDAFQKIADAATNARGATKEIGTALTRICLRHKAVETRIKTFTSAIMDCLIVPLQEKLEDWKKAVLTLDKDHAKDYKRARSELKKRSTDTLRLQKKLRKGAGGDLQKRLECGLQDVTERRQLLEETEKQAIRCALLEERSRFCIFVNFLKPVVNEEVAMLTELSHLQEVVEQLDKHTADPQVLPPASEQVIADLKSCDSSWSFQTPPSSPSSLGSRKSSMCSISSLNSSSSGSSKSHSPSHPYWQRSLSQPVTQIGTMRLTSVSSQDSGFTSQDTLYPRPPSSLSVAQVSNMSEHSSSSSSSSTPCTPFPPSIPNTTATWPNLQETIQFERAATAIISDRPHTISSAYEKGHQRPPLTVYTFQAPEQSLSQPTSPVTSTSPSESNSTISQPRSPAPSIKSIASKPPLPVRCSSLERTSGPHVPTKTVKSGVRVLPPGNIEHKLMKPTPLPAHLAKDIPQPTYVNMHELASMSAAKAQDMNLPPPPAEFITPLGATNEKAPEIEKDGNTSESSLESSSGYGSQTTFPVEDVMHIEDVTMPNLEMAGKYCTLPRNGDQFNASRRRPVSMSAVYSGGTIRNTLLRRGSTQVIRPPPPIRRTSSIVNPGRLLTPVNCDENLPPPPAFLLEPAKNPGLKVAETVKALTELKHTPASPGSVRRLAASTQSLHTGFVSPTNSQPSVFSTFQTPVQTKPSYVSQSVGLIYAHPSQIISNSPSEVRRVNSLRSQSAERRPGDGPGGVGSSFIAALSAKLTPSMSPRCSRRHSDDLGPSYGAAPVNKLAQKGPGQNFLDSLNVKLAQQHISNNTQQPQLKALKIRQIINSKAQPDPKICHESLMDQIKKGANLRRAKVINDRSAPKIY